MPTLNRARDLSFEYGRSVGKPVAIDFGEAGGQQFGPYVSLRRCSDLSSIRSGKIVGTKEIEWAQYICALRRIEQRLPVVSTECNALHESVLYAMNVLRPQT